MSLLAVNLFVLLVSLCTFEIKSLLNDGWNYFKSFYNQNDIALFTFSVVNLAQEILFLKSLKASGSTPSTNPTDEGETFDPLTYYTYGRRESVMRVTYSIMIIVVHIKLLNVFSFYGQVAFLVKMIEKLVVNI